MDESSVTAEDILPGERWCPCPYTASVASVQLTESPSRAIFTKSVNMSNMLHIPSSQEREPLSLHTASSHGHCFFSSHIAGCRSECSWGTGIHFCSQLDLWKEEASLSSYYGGSEGQRGQVASLGSPSWGVAEPVTESLGLSTHPGTSKGNILDGYINIYQLQLSLSNYRALVPGPLQMPKPENT